jgi:hypothetical protein
VAVGQCESGERLRKADLLAQISRVYAQAEELLKAELASSQVSKDCKVANSSGKPIVKAVAVGPGGAILVPRSKKNKKK